MGRRKKQGVGSPREENTSDVPASGLSPSGGAIVVVLLAVIVGLSMHWLSSLKAPVVPDQFKGLDDLIPADRKPMKSATSPPPTSPPTPPPTPPEQWQQQRQEQPLKLDAKDAASGERIEEPRPSKSSVEKPKPPEHGFSPRSKPLAPPGPNPTPTALSPTDSDASTHSASSASTALDPASPPAPLEHSSTMSDGQGYKARNKDAAELPREPSTIHEGTLPSTHRVSADSPRSSDNGEQRELVDLIQRGGKGAAARALEIVRKGEFDTSAIVLNGRGVQLPLFLLAFDFYSNRDRSRDVLALLQELLERGADPDALARPPQLFNGGTRPLWMAARLNHLRLMELLFRHGASTNAISGEFPAAGRGVSPLHIIAELGRNVVPIAKYFISMASAFQGLPVDERDVAALVARTSAIQFNPQDMMAESVGFQRLANDTAISLKRAHDYRSLLQAEGGAARWTLRRMLENGLNLASMDLADSSGHTVSLSAPFGTKNDRLIRLHAVPTHSRRYTSPRSRAHLSPSRHSRTPSSKVGGGSP